ncbi:MAG: hypothetical protein SGI73_06350 [Chloroflexota bacterium]|nr:hypothetical protein [Chloroflexota bacterium]
MKKPLSMRLFAMATLKHLPPSASSLRLIDWTDGSLGSQLPYLRADLNVMRRRPDVDLPDDSADAIIAFAQSLDAETLAAGLRLLRAGGRLIAVDPAGEPDKSYVERLESAGYTRILVEAALDDPALSDAALGVLMRGEKPHTTDDTLARVRIASDRDAPLRVGADEFAAYSGNYVHVLIRQTPNIPVWARKPDAEIVWEAVFVDGSALVFSSLPKAVAFMQQAVLRGQIAGVNKIAKFSAELARLFWTFPARVNADVSILDGRAVTFVRLERQYAEAPDE